MQPTTAGLVHTALAGLCIVLGLAQLMQRKGGAAQAQAPKSATPQAAPSPQSNQPPAPQRVGA